jgi:sigma-B regulation protein RsbU (phosphoserine phosphatase)
MSRLSDGLKAPEQIGSERNAVRRLTCTEVWGGNDTVELVVEVPGIIGWIHSKPLPPAVEGGDVYYLTVCSTGSLSRIVLADVAGHGQAVGASVATLRNLLRKHMNALDQSVLMQEINEAFRREDEREEVQYATAAVFGYFWKNRQLVFTNAGHPFALWYRATERTWDWLHDQTPYAQTTVEGVPLGLIIGTEYRQSAVRLGDGDILILYTDGISESTNEAGEELGYDGLLGLARSLPVETATLPSTVGQALLSAVEAFSAGSPALDDQSLMVLVQTRDTTSYQPQPIED